MKWITLFPLALLAAALVSTAAQKRPMALDDMFRIKRVSGPQLSPDGSWIAYVITEVNKDENTLNSDIWLVSSDGGEPRQLTGSPKHDRHPRWSPDGKWLAFESNRGGSYQIYLIRTDGGEARQLTTISTEANQPVWSPDGKKIAFVSAVFPEFSDRPFKESDAANKKKSDEREKSKVKARVITQLLYRHWDSWVDDKRQHLFVVPVEGGEPRDLTPGDRDAVPTSSTFSAGDEFDFSPDGKEIVFTATPVPAREEAWSTNHDLYSVNVETGERRQLTSNPAADGCPRFSPDGNFLAYRAQARPGAEADRWQLMLLNRATGQRRSLTERFDSWVESFLWSQDSKTLYFEAEEKGAKPIWSVSVEGGDIKKLATGGANSDVGVSSDGQRLVFARSSFSRPTEVFVSSIDGGSLKPLSRANDELFDQLDFEAPESVAYTGAAGAQIQMWIIKPPGFDASRKYPLVFWVHGDRKGRSRTHGHLDGTRSSGPRKTTCWRSRIRGAAPGSVKSSSMRSAMIGRAKCSRI